MGLGRRSGEVNRPHGHHISGTAEPFLVHKASQVRTVFRTSTSGQTKVAVMTKFCFSIGGGGQKQTLSRNIIGMVPAYNRPALMVIATFLLTTPHSYYIVSY